MRLNRGGGFPTRAFLIQDAGWIGGQPESLGHNCEFGLVQRSYDIEPFGLLRWASSPVEAVIRGLRTRFAGLGQNILHINSTAADCATGLIFHSNLKVDRTEAEVRHQEARRLPRLADKLIEDIMAGEGLDAGSHP